MCEQSSYKFEYKGIKTWSCRLHKLVAPIVLRTDRVDPLLDLHLPRHQSWPFPILKYITTYEKSLERG